MRYFMEPKGLEDLAVRLAWRFEEGATEGDVIDVSNPDDAWEPAYCHLSDMFLEEETTLEHLPPHAQ